MIDVETNVLVTVMPHAALKEPLNLKMKAFENVRRPRSFLLRLNSCLNGFTCTGNARPDGSSGLRIESFVNRKLLLPRSNLEKEMTSDRIKLNAQCRMHPSIVSEVVGYQAYKISCLSEKLTVRDKESIELRKLYQFDFTMYVNQKGT